MKEALIYNTGTPETIVFPGLTHTAEDWIEFSLRYREPLMVPENGFHTGIPDTNGKASWPDWWQEALLELVRAYPSLTRIIAHSRGVVDALDLISKMPQIKDISLVCPPISDRLPSAEERMNFPSSEVSGRTIDACLSGLCKEIDDKTYGALVQRHIQSYGAQFHKIWKRESPSKTDLRNRCVQLLGELPNNLNISMVVGEQDPWNDDVELERIQRARPTMLISKIDSGHFPHVSAPGELARLVKN